MTKQSDSDRNLRNETWNNLIELFTTKSFGSRNTMFETLKNSPEFIGNKHSYDPSSIKRKTNEAISLADQLLNPCVIVSRYNINVVGGLLGGVLTALKQLGYTKKPRVISVYGSFEIPAVLKSVSLSNKYNVALCLGSLIRGNTVNFDYLTSSVIQGIMDISIQSIDQKNALNQHSKSKITLQPKEFQLMAIGHAILTTDTMEEALQRAGNPVQHNTDDDKSHDAHHRSSYTCVDNKGYEATMATIENFYKMISISGDYDYVFNLKESLSLVNVDDQKL